MALTLADKLDDELTKKQKQNKKQSINNNKQLPPDPNQCDAMRPHGRRACTHTPTLTCVHTGTGFHVHLLT